MSELTSDRDPFEVVAESFLARYRAGERPSIDELADRHPELAGHIRRLLPALVRVEQDLTIDPEPGPAAKAMPPAPPPSSRQLGDYRILGEIGRGGMGTVYEAEQVSLGRRVALKVLPGHAVGDRKAEDRFRREAKAAARLHHTNIVPVFEVGREGDVTYYAMQLISGQGLDQVIEELKRLPDAAREAHTKRPGPARAATSEGPPPPAPGQIAESLLSGRLLTEGRESPAYERQETSAPAATEPLDAAAAPDHESAMPDVDNSSVEHPRDPSSSAVLPGGTPVSAIDTSDRRQPYFRSVAQIGRQVAQGLAYAHARGVVHRDIKPSNLLLDTSGVVWITDFGLAKAEEDGLTATGELLGTLRYMAPERFRGQGDALADIYALGLTLYELVTLRPAYRSTDRLRLIEEIKNEEPAPPRSLDDRIPRDLGTIVLKAMDKLPERRYPTADAMAEDLRRFLADEPIKARQIGTTERYWRWARRNPVIAILGGVLTALLFAATVGSLVTASHFRTIASSASLANQKSQLARKDAIEARRQVTMERDRSLQLSASLALEKGIALGEEGRADQGLHWMLEALRNAPANAENFRKAVRWNLGAWLGQVHRPLWITEGAGDCSHLGFSPDGKIFASGFAPRDRVRATPIVLWDTATGAKLRTLDGAFAPFAFSPDGRFLYATAEPRGVLALELSTGRVLWTTLDLPGEGPVNIGLSPDLSTVLAHRTSPKGRDWMMRLDAATGQPRGEPLVLPGLAAVAPDGGSAALVRSDDGELWIDLHEIPSCRRRESWRAGGSDWDGGGFMFRFSPDGALLFGSFREGGMRYQDDSRVARIWSTEKGRPASPLMLSTFYSTYSPAADRLLTKTDNHWLWRRALDGQVMGSGFPAGDNHAPMTHPDGRTIINTGIDHSLYLWQVSHDVEPIAEVRARGRTIDPGTRAEKAPTGVTHLKDGFLTDGRIVLTAGRAASGREQIQVADLATGRAMGRPAPHQPGWMIRGLALSPDGRSFATGSNPDGRLAGEVRVWDTLTGRLRFRPLLLSNYVVGLAFRPDGKVLASGDFSGFVRLWDLSTGMEIGRPLPQEEIVLALAYSPDGKTLAVGLSNDHSGKPGIRLWDTETRKPAGDRWPSTESIGRIEFRPDGRALLAVHGHHTQLWDVTEGRPVGGPMADETSGGFRPDGRAFLTLGTDGTIKLRDAATGSVMSRLMTAKSPAVCAVWRGEGDLVAVGFKDGSVRLCDPATSLPIGPPRVMENAVNKVAFSPDGMSFAGIDTAGVSRTWPIPRTIADEGPDEWRLRVEARTGLVTESDRSIARLDTPAWRERLDRLARRDPAAVRPDVDPAWHEPMAREAEQAGNEFAAIWHLDRLAAAYPDDWALFARRARAWSLSDRLDKAAEDFEMAGRLGGREPVLDFQRHCALESARAGRWATALWYLDRLIAALPDDGLLREERAAVYGKLGREADRQVELARVFELGADEGLVMPRAEELGRAGRWAEAADLLARCGRQGPLSRELAQAWGLATLKVGDFAGYREVCTAFLDSQEPEPAVFWNAMAAASMLALSPAAPDRFASWIDWFEHRLSITPPPTPLYRHLVSNALGGLLLRAGRLDEAIARLDEGMVASQDQFPGDWAFLALAYARTGRLAEARKWLARLRAWQVNASATYWDLEEVDLIRSEIELWLLDAEFPSEPFSSPCPR